MFLFPSLAHPKQEEIKIYNIIFLFWLKKFKLHALVVEQVQHNKTKHDRRRYELVVHNSYAIFSTIKSLPQY